MRGVKNHIKDLKLHLLEDQRELFIKALKVPYVHMYMYTCMCMYIHVHNVVHPSMHVKQSVPLPYPKFQKKMVHNNLLFSREFILKLLKYSVVHLNRISKSMRNITKI